MTWKSLYGRCLAVKELFDTTTSSISNTKPASQLVKCKYPYSSEKDRHLRMKVFVLEPLHISEAEGGCCLVQHSVGSHFTEQECWKPLLLLFLCVHRKTCCTIFSLLFLLMHMPFQIDLVTPNQIYLIWSSWCQMSFWFSNRGSINSVMNTAFEQAHRRQKHFSDRILLQTHNSTVQFLAYHIRICSSLMVFTNDENRCLHKALWILKHKHRLFLYGRVYNLGKLDFFDSLVDTGHRTLI